MEGDQGSNPHHQDGGGGGEVAFIEGAELLMNKDISAIDGFGKPSPQHERERYTGISVLLTVFSILLFFFDYGSDIWIIVLLYDESGFAPTTLLTIVLVFVPLLLVNIFSLVWYHQDHNISDGGFCPARKTFIHKEQTVLLVFHFLLIGPVIRQLHIIWCGRREKGKHINVYYQLRKYYERDSAYLALIDSFLQDAPQLMLQSYILLTRNPEDLYSTTTVVIQLGSVLLSLSSISWAMVSHVAACHRADPSLSPLSLPASVVNWFWRLGMLSSRFFTFTLFLTVYPQEFLLFCSLHFAVMLLCILKAGTKFCSTQDGVKRPLEELLYDIVMAGIYVFDILNIVEGKTRWRNLCYYLLSGVELTVLLVAWRARVCSSTSLPAWNYHPVFQGLCIGGICGSFLMGILFIYIYYTRFHDKRQEETSNIVTLELSQLSPYTDTQLYKQQDRQIGTDDKRKEGVCPYSDNKKVTEDPQSEKVCPVSNRQKVMDDTQFQDVCLLSHETDDADRACDKSNRQDGTDAKQIENIDDKKVLYKHDETGETHKPKENRDGKRK